MPFIVNYQMRRYQDGVNYSSVLNLFTDKLSFRLRFQVDKSRGICCSQFSWVVVSHLYFFGWPAFFKDGLNFDGRPLKIIGFWKHCSDKLYGLLK